MRKEVAVLALVVGLGTVAYQGCGGVHQNPGEGGASSLSTEDAGFQAFQSGFYAFTKSQNCAMCHGNFQSPKFADPNPDTAYSFFKTLVNVNDPTSSIIITYAGNGHCSAAPCSDPSVRPAVTSMLQSWAAAEKTSGGGGVPSGPKYITDSLAIPTPLPALGTAPKVVRFPLSGFKIPALSNAILEIEMNAYNANEYKVARLKIGGATAQVTVTGVHVYVRSSTSTGIGIEDPNQGVAWTSLVAAVNATTLPATLPTTPLAAANATVLSTTSLGIAVQSTSDVITIGFDDIQNGASAVPSVVHFTDLVSANQQLGVFQQSCVACHSGAAPSAGLDLTNYTQAKAKASTIMARANSSTQPMPPSGLLGATPRQVINNWVSGGALQ